MKTFKMTVMALLLMTAGAYMSACSSSDNEKTAEQVTDPIQTNVEYYIEGKVTNNSNPVAGVSVAIDGYDAVSTDEKGHFILTVKEAKAFTMECSKAGYLTKQTIADLTGEPNRSVVALSIEMTPQEPATAISRDNNYVVEPAKATEVQNEDELANIGQAGAYIPKEAIAEGTEISMTMYTPSSNTQKSDQKNISAPVTAFYINVSSGSIEATEEKPVVLALNNPSKNKAFTEMNVYKTTQSVTRAENRELIGTAIYDSKNNNYQLKLTSGILEGGYEFDVPITRTVGETKKETVGEGTLDNSGSMEAIENKTISYTTQLGWELKTPINNDLAPLIEHALQTQEGNKGLMDITYTTTTNVSGESIVYWKANRNFTEITYTFQTSDGEVSALVVLYKGVTFTYTVEDGRHSGGTSGTQN